MTARNQDTVSSGTDPSSPPSARTTNPADIFRAAHKRIQEGDNRVDSSLRRHLAEVLAAAAISHEASVIAAHDTWPDAPQTAAAWIEGRVDQPMLDLARRIVGPHR